MLANSGLRRRTYCQCSSSSATSCLRRASTLASSLPATGSGLSPAGAAASVDGDGDGDTEDDGDGDGDAGGGLLAQPGATSSMAMTNPTTNLCMTYLIFSAEP